MNPNFSKSKIFLIFCVSFIAGIALGKFLSYEIMAFAAMFFVVLGSIGWASRSMRIIAFAGLILLLGSWRFVAMLAPDDLPRFYGQKVEAEAVISEEPDNRLDKTFLTLNDLVISGESIRGKVLVQTHRFPEYEYGEMVNFTGKIQEPKDAEVAGEFSYKNYLSNFGISAVVYNPKIETTGVMRGSVVKRNLLKGKTEFVEKLSELLPEPHNSFLGGLLVGLRRGIPKDLTDAFNATGTTHIIAISGFNITIIAWFIDYILLNFFRRRVSFILSLIAIALFVIMAGGSASVVRAGIMGSLGLLALNIGRLSSITNAMALTAAVMAFINPKIIHFDVGFQLSFLALMGLVYLSPKLEPRFIRIPKLLRQFWVATISAQIFTLPILLYNFDRLSLIAPVANVLILPVIPLIMLVGFIAGLLAVVWGPLSLIFIWSAYVLMEYVIRIAQILSSIPLASVQFDGLPVWTAIVYYLALAWLLWKEKLKTYFSI